MQLPAEAVMDGGLVTLQAVGVIQSRHSRTAEYCVSLVLLDFWLGSAGFRF